LTAVPAWRATVSSRLSTAAIVVRSASPKPTADAAPIDAAEIDAL
jgi:hypothetical protein